MIDKFVFYGNPETFVAGAKEIIEAIHYFCALSPLTLEPKHKEKTICIRITIEQVEEDQ